MGWPKHPGDPQAHRELAARHLAVVQERDALKAELAALRSRPSEKSVEKCVAKFEDAYRADCDRSGSTFRSAERAGISAVRAFLLDEEAGRG